jgi:hypothetical protein
VGEEAENSVRLHVRCVNGIAISATGGEFNGVSAPVKSSVLVTICDQL